MTSLNVLHKIQTSLETEKIFWISFLPKVNKKFNFDRIEIHYEWLSVEKDWWDFNAEKTREIMSFGQRVTCQMTCKMSHMIKVYAMGEP